MKLSRRSIFGLAAGAAVAPIMPVVPAAAKPILVFNGIPKFINAAEITERLSLVAKRLWLIIPGENE